MLINEIAIRCNAPLAPEAVRALMAHTDWACQRNVPDIATMLRHTTLHVSGWQRWF